MACVETAIEYLNSFQKHLKNKGYQPHEASWATGIVVDKEDRLVPYMVCDSHRSFKKSLRQLVDGAGIETVPFIFLRITPCEECLPQIREKIHAKEGIKHFEIRPFDSPITCRHK